MGMLDILKKGYGMLTDPRTVNALTYLQQRHHGIPASQIDEWNSRQAYYDSAMQDREEEKRRQEEERRRAEMEAAIQGEERGWAQGQLADPTARATLATDPARMMRMAEALPGPVLNAAMGAMAPQQSSRDKLGTVTEGGVTYYVERDPVSGQMIRTPLGRPDASEQQGPAALQEWAAFKAMGPEEQNRFLEMKRGAPEASSVAQKFTVQALDNQARSLEQVGKIKALTDGLAQIPDSDWTAGAAGKLTELGKTTFGVEDNVTLLRTLANEVSMAKALSILPPGVASDRDVALAMSTTLPPTTNKETLLSWLRGAQKVAEIRAQHANFQLQHMQNDPVTGLFTVGPAWQKYSESLYESGPAAESEPLPDVTTMTDEQLRAIAEGRNP